MARIGICESSPEVAGLIAEVVRYRGHEPVVANPIRGRPDVDLLLAEPATPGALELVRTVREQSPEIPVVFVSIYERTPETTLLEPAAHIVKPFTIAQLEAAIDRALAARNAT